MESLKNKIIQRDVYDTEYLDEEMEADFNFRDEFCNTKESIKKSLKNSDVVLVSLEKNEGLYYCQENNNIYFVTTDEEDFFEDEDNSEFYEISIKEADQFIENYLSKISEEANRIKEIEAWLDDIA